MRIPGAGIVNYLSGRLSNWVMGARESDDTSQVLYDRTLLWLTPGAGCNRVCDGDIGFNAGGTASE